MAISVLLIRFERSLFSRINSSFLLSISALMVCNSSFTDCNSSLAVSMSSFEDCSSSLID